MPDHVQQERKPTQARQVQPPARGQGDCPDCYNEMGEKSAQKVKEMIDKHKRGEKP